MIRSSSHPTLFLNYNKKIVLEDFLTEYRRVGSLIIKEIWENGYADFNISKDALNLPQYLDYKKFQIETLLSARALSSLVVQASGVIRSVVEKRKRMLWVLAKLKLEDKPTSSLEKKLNNDLQISMPNFNYVKAELSSKCANIKKTTGEFEYFLELCSLGKEFGKIRIPIKGTAVSQKWNQKGKLMNSFLIGDGEINLRFEVEKKNPKLGEKTVGIDQGMKTVATFSDGQITPETDIHGHSLESIMDKMSRKQKGSRAFKKAQVHRKQFINWSLNQVNFTEFKEIRLEKIWNISYKRKQSRKMSHWTNTLIRDKIKSLAEEAEVPLIEQDSSYRSQRCSSCGSVRKANRKKKLYCCKHCGFSCDADLNASLNHVVDLPDIAFSIRGKRYNLGDGFYWLKQGLFTFDGQELRVSDSL